MSLQPSLQYNKREDVIEGFQDTGTKKKSFANHACVFMLRGIRRKWKQTVGYYVVENSIGSTNLAKAIKEIVRSARLVGLNIVATVCNQSSINCSTLKSLEQESWRNFIRQEEEMKPGRFYVDGNAVIILFDLPHLLRGIRNNLLNSKAKFIWKEPSTQLAWWEDALSSRR